MRLLPAPDFFKPGILRQLEVESEMRRAARKAVVHVSHADCLDGAGSDVLVRLKHGSDRVATVYCDPAEVLDRLRALARARGRGQLLISDLSLQVGQAEEVAETVSKLTDAGWRVEWRDHHHKQWEKGALEVVAKAADAVNLNADGTECGTSLVQKDLLPGDEFAQELAEIIRDVDLWIRKDPRSTVLTHARHEWGSEAFVAKMIRDKRFVDKATEDAAKAWEKRFERDAREALRHARVAEGKNRVGVVYGDLPGSDVCDRLREEKGTDVEINLKPSGKFSVRSRPGLPICHTLAQRFGGGGHPHAAGGMLAMGPLAWTIYWSSRGDSLAARRLVEAAEDAVPEKVP